MTREETKKILLQIQALYPNWKPQADIGFMVDVWHEYTKDYTYQQMVVAMKAYISTDKSGFAPSIGQLVEKLYTISKPKELNETEAWSLVKRALSNGLYGAEEEFDKLPPEVQEAVGSPGVIREWAMNDTETSKSVARTSFMRTYKTVVSRRKEMDKMPSKIKEIIEKNMPKIEQAKNHMPKPEHLIGLPTENAVPMPEEYKKRVAEHFGEGSGSE